MVTNNFLLKDPASKKVRPCHSLKVEKFILKLSTHVIGATVVNKIRGNVGNYKVRNFEGHLCVCKVRSVSGARENWISLRSSAMQSCDSAKVVRRFEGGELRRIQVECTLHVLSSTFQLNSNLGSL